VTERLFISRYYKSLITGVHFEESEDLNYTLYVAFAGLPPEFIQAHDKNHCCRWNISIV